MYYLPDPSLPVFWSQYSQARHFGPTWPWPGIMHACSAPNMLKTPTFDQSFRCKTLSNEIYTTAQLIAKRGVRDMLDRTRSSASATDALRHVEVLRAVF